MQILVEVANIQIEPLKPDEGKVSMRTTIGHGLAGPKSRSVSFEFARKGSGLIFLRQPSLSGNAATHLTQNEVPLWRFLCQLTQLTCLGIRSTGEEEVGRNSDRTSGACCASLFALEKGGMLVRLTVLISASGLLGEQPLADG